MNIPSFRSLLGKVSVGFLVIIGSLSSTHYVHAVALSGVDVQPASLVAGATGSVTISFTTTTTIPVDGKVYVIFPAGFDTTGVNGGTCSTMDGTFTTSIYGGVGQTVRIARNGDGTPQTGAAETCTLAGIRNPTVSGSTGTYGIEVTDLVDSDLDVDFAVAADTITPGALSSTNVAPATLVAGASGTATVTFTTANAIPNNGVIKVTFGANFNVASAASGTCSSQDGTYVTTVSGQVVTLTRQGDGGSEPAGAQTCTIGGIVNPPISGTTGTYTIATFLTGGSTGIDIDASVAADTITVGALSSTNVEPTSLRKTTTNVVTISFTTANAIPATGKIKITFPSGFNVASAASGTCSTMDGSFATGVSGQVVTITRSGGASQSAAAESCTVSGIINPTTSGSTGTYTIATTDASDVGIDINSSVTADTITSAGSSSTPAALTYEIEISAPDADAICAPGSPITITWSTEGTGSVSGVNLLYATDGATYSSIVGGTPNDGSYSWTAPDIHSDSVTIRAEATDLVTVLATDTSDTFTVSSTETEDADTDTSDITDDTGDVSSGEVLSEGTFMKGSSWSTVYYIDADGTRRPFMDAQTFFTYADSFDEVTTVADSELANYSMGAPMLAKSGSVLVKIQSVNAVYVVVDVDGVQTLRWITSETLAQDLFGTYWTDYVIDVPPTAWSHFTVGDDIDAASDIDVNLDDMHTRTELASK